MEIEISKEKFQKLKEGFLGNLSYTFEKIYKLLFKDKGFHTTIKNIDDKSSIKINGIEKNPYKSSKTPKIKQIGTIDFNDRLMNFEIQDKNRFTNTFDFYPEIMNSNQKMNLEDKYGIHLDTINELIKLRNKK